MTGRLNRSSGLFAQPMILRLLDHETAQAQRHRTPLTVVRMALVLPNNRDEEVESALRMGMAHVLNTQLRAVDLPGHLEDEYLIILPVTTALGSRALVKRLVEAVAALEPPPVPVTAACAGIATHPGGPDCDGNLLADQATTALREAQQRGPQSVVEFSDLSEV